MGYTDYEIDNRISSGPGPGPGWSVEVEDGCGRLGSHVAARIWCLSTISLDVVVAGLEEGRETYHNRLLANSGVTYL